MGNRWTLVRVSYERVETSAPSSAVTCDSIRDQIRLLGFTCYSCLSRGGPSGRALCQTPGSLVSPGPRLLVVSFFLPSPSGEGLPF